MKRNHIPTIATTLTLAFATGTALAQANAPDFSPMRPGNNDELQSQSSSSTQPRYASPGYDTPLSQPDNRMLDAYESSAAPIQDTATAPYEERSRPRLRVSPPRQSTIGNGLFNRQGPDDFGG